MLIVSVSFVIARPVLFPAAPVNFAQMEHAAAKSNDF